MKELLSRVVTIVLLLFIIVGVATADTYYVSLTGNDSNTGTSPDSSWRHIAYAASHVYAGDTVKIKGGNYGHEHVVISNSGTAGNPIVFEGYDGMPVIDGQDRTGKGIDTNYKDNLEIRNIEVTKYEFGVFVNNSEYVTLDDIIAINLGGSGYSGWGIYLQSSHNCVVRNCSVTDARAVNIILWHSNYNLMENCTSYGIATDNATDYYILIGYSIGNIIQNCISENRHQWSERHPGHGIGVKDDYYNGYSSPHSYNNKIINCESHGHGEHFFVAHCAYDNEFINCTAYNDSLIPYHQWNDGFVVRDGAYDNIFKNCRAVGRLQCGLDIHDGTEGPNPQTQSGNIFENCIVEGNPRVSAIWLGCAGAGSGPSTDNVFKNIVVDDAPYLYRIRGVGNTGNTITNSIITNVNNLKYTYSGATGNLAETYCNFWNNGFGTPSGQGNIEEDPLFADPSNSDYHLKSEYGRWDGSGWVYDNITSPCIDSGHPNDSFDYEPYPNGGRINMGAYGNTIYASKSPGGAIGFIAGTVTDTFHSAIQGVTVTAGSYSDITNSQGKYIITVLVDTYTVVASKSGYFPDSIVDVIVTENDTTYVDFQLEEASDLVGFWRFEHGSGTTAYDSSVYGNDGTIYGASWTPDTFGYALQFDGDDDCVNCGNDISLDITEEITIIAWVYPLSLGESNYPRIVNKGDPYSLLLMNGNKLEFYLQDDNGNPHYIYSDSNSVPFNQWSHCAVVYDGAVQRIYINAVQDTDTLEWTGQIATNSNNLYIGNREDTERTFDGIIDEVKIYNRALTAQEIQNEYISSVEEGYVNIPIPNKYKLFAVYPNPFELQTTIRYQLPVTSNVCLRIYDIGGRLVKTLVNEFQSAGYYQVVWDGRNDRGEEVFSGLYFYQLRTGDYISTNKLLILK